MLAPVIPLDHDFAALAVEKSVRKDVGLLCDVDNNWRFVFPCRDAVVGLLHKLDEMAVRGRCVLRFRGAVECAPSSSSSTAPGLVLPPLASPRALRLRLRPTLES